SASAKGAGAARGGVPAGAPADGVGERSQAASSRQAANAHASIRGTDLRFIASSGFQGAAASQGTQVIEQRRAPCVVQGAEALPGGRRLATVPQDGLDQAAGTPVVKQAAALAY